MNFFMTFLIIEMHLYLKKKIYVCLLGKSDKQLCFFIYVHHILQCIDWNYVCLQSIANQCNNIIAIVPLHLRKIPFRKKTGDAVNQAMIEVEEWDDFLLA